MVRWLSCHLFRLHEYAVQRDASGVFLHCDHCGHHSTGWKIGPVDPLASLSEPHQTLPRPPGRVRMLLSELGLIHVVRRV